LNKNNEYRWEVAYYFSYNFLKFTNQFFFIIQWDVPLMYPEFDYKLQKITLNSCTKFTRIKDRSNQIGK